MCELAVTCGTSIDFTSGSGGNQHAGARPPQEIRVQLRRGQRRHKLVRHGARDLADLGEALSLGGAAFLGEGIGEVGEEERRAAPSPRMLTV